MNHNILCGVIAECKVKNMTKMALINKEFYSLVQSPSYLINLNKMDKYYLFIKACQHNKYDVIKILLNYVDPSILNNYTLRWVCVNGHVEVVKLLL